MLNAIHRYSKDISLLIAKEIHMHYMRLCHDQFNGLFRYKDKYNMLMSGSVEAFNYRTCSTQDGHMHMIPPSIYKTMGHGTVIDYEQMGNLPKRYVYSSGSNRLTGYCCK